MSLSKGCRRMLIPLGNREPAGRGRRGRGGGGLFPGRSEQNGLVEPGTYTVTLKVDGEEFSHTFTVGRADTAPIWQ